MDVVDIVECSYVFLHENRDARQKGWPSLRRGMT